MMMEQQQQYDAMLTTLAEVNELCGKAQRHFHIAKELERKAMHADRVAGVGAFVDGGRMFEKAEQLHRGNKMNRAREEAHHGSKELRRAFALIPRDGQPCLLRERYPKEMSRIGTVPIPELDGGRNGGAMVADFAMGGFGAEMNDMRKRKQIGRNLEVITQCEMICSEQQRLLLEMTDRVRADRAGRRVGGEEEEAVALSCEEREYREPEYVPQAEVPVARACYAEAEPAYDVAPSEMYVDGGMGMGGMGMDGMDMGMGGMGMDMGMRGGGMGGMGGMGMMEGVMMGDMIARDDRIRREDRFIRREDRFDRREDRREENRFIRREERCGGFGHRRRW